MWQTKWKKNIKKKKKTHGGGLWKLKKQKQERRKHIEHYARTDLKATW